MAGQPNPETIAAAESFAAPPLFAPGEVREMTDRVTGALRRHSQLAVRIFLVTLGVTALAIPVLPRSYHVGARMLALPPEGAPGAARPNGNDPGGLAEGAAQVVLSHENLLRIIRDQDLVDCWDLNRGLLLRSVDRVRRVLGTAALDPARRELEMIRHLEKKLTVEVKGAQVLISFDWSDPRTAVAVVDAVQKKLMEARREAEIAPLERKVQSLEASAAETDRRVGELTERVTAALLLKRRGARPASVGALQAEGKFRDLPDAALAAARLDLIARRKAIFDLEDARRKRLAELNAILAEQRVTLGPENAALRETEEKIRALQRDRQLRRLRADEQERLAAFVRAGGREVELSSAEIPLAWPAELKEDDPALAFERSRIAVEETGLGRLRAEVEEARQALAATQVAFQSRYAVLAPPEIPDGPAFPNVVLLLIAGALGGALAAATSAVAADLLGPANGEEVRTVALLAKAPHA